MPEQIGSGSGNCPFSVASCRLPVAYFVLARGTGKPKRLVATRLPRCESAPLLRRQRAGQRRRQLPLHPEELAHDAVAEQPAPPQPRRERVGARRLDLDVRREGRARLEPEEGGRDRLGGVEGDAPHPLAAERYTRQDAPLAVVRDRRERAPERLAEIV